MRPVRRIVTNKLKAAYFRLAYLQQTLSVLERNDQLLNDVEQKENQERTAVLSTALSIIWPRWGSSRNSGDLSCHL